MLFSDDATQGRLNAIIRGAAIGEALGVLASRMSSAERAEKLTPEEIHHMKIDHCQSSTSVELLKATITGLERARSMECASNLDIRFHLHQAYRDWARSSRSASMFRNLQLVRVATSGPLGSFTSTERGGCEGMLLVAPIGLAFADDPGRAFQVGGEAGALLDADFYSYLSAGVVALMVALMAQGMVTTEAIVEVQAFIRPLDWAGEMSNAIHSVLEGDAFSGGYSNVCCRVLTAALAAIGRSTTMSDTLVIALAASPRSATLSLAAQFASVMGMSHTDVTNV